MTPELETELRTEIERLREVNAELSVTKGVSLLRFEVSPAEIHGHSIGVKVMVTASLGDEFAMQMVSMCLAQIGGAVAAAGVTPPPPPAPEAAS